MPTIDVLLLSVRVAKEVSAEIPIPGLSTALMLAVSIMEKAKVRVPHLHRHVRVPPLTMPFLPGYQKHSR